MAKNEGFVTIGERLEQRKSEGICPLCNGSGKFSHHHGDMKVIVMRLARQFNVSERTVFRWISDVSK
jgi:hypothetical protein